LLSTFQSSGDLVADRRAGYARLLAEAGDAAAAAEVMAQALELAPGWAAGWSLLGDFRKAAGDPDGAVAAWRQLDRLDGAGIFGAALKLAAAGAGLAVEHTAEGYVAALFDAYARDFEAVLLQRLDYVVPERLAGLVAAEMQRRGTERLGHAVDAGCGTGLMGERLRRHVSYLEGVDLSAGMVAAAAAKGIYDRVSQDELVGFLVRPGAPADLVAAADVLVYCGALAPVFAGVAARLAPGGLFAFSCERHDGTEPMVVRESLRFAHEPGAARAALAAAGLEVLAWEEGVLRSDRGRPVAGLFVLAARPQALGHGVAAAPAGSAEDAPACN
jgi:predicted TPR repeat methyltransferase